MRPYRHKLVTQGQHSPLKLNEPVARLIERYATGQGSSASALEQLRLLDSNALESLRLLDIGCGLGAHARLFRQRFPRAHIAGIDWSPATVAHLRSTRDSPFDAVHLCSSATLPLPDKSADIGISMENLEHLYTEDVLPALQEQARVSRFMIITTPITPETMNIRWLCEEIPAAAQDPVALTSHDYTCLESAVHKSTVFPGSMRAAGFDAQWTGVSMIYSAPSDRVDLTRVRVAGISRAAFEATHYASLQDKYVALLKTCVRVHGDLIVGFIEEQSDETLAS